VKLTPYNGTKAMADIFSKCSCCVYKVRDRSMVNRRTGKQCTDVRMCTPQVMTDHLTATEVVDLKTEMTIALVCFEQRGVRVRTEILSRTNTNTLNDTANLAPYPTA